MPCTAFADIKVKEQSIENLMRGRKVFEPPRFMTVNQCCEQLLEVESKRQLGICTPTTLAVGLARVGQADQQIVSGTLEELRTVDFGKPLHSLVIVGEMDSIEAEMVEIFKISPATPRLEAAQVAESTACLAAATLT